MNASTGALWRRHEDRLPPLAGYPLLSRRFTAGQTIVTAGEPLQWLGFIVEGSAAVRTLMENGRVAMITEYRGVQTVGELELLTQEPAYLTCDIRAITVVEMLYIPLDAAREKLLHDAAMLRFLGREVARKLEQTSRLAAQDRLYPLAARLAAYLLHACRDGVAAPHLTRLSELMGTSYRHLLRTLGLFGDAGWIAREGGGYRVLDADALARLGEGVRYD